MLAHEIHGQGDRVAILLHGFLGSARNLGTLARRWAERDPSRRLVAADLTGHGSSPPLPPGADLGTLAGDVLALANHLALAQPVEIVGHSLGGRVALKAALLAPHAVGPLTLLDIAPGPIEFGDFVLQALVDAPAHPTDRASVRELLRERGVPPNIADWLLMNLVRDESGLRWRVDRTALAELRARGNVEDLWPAVESGRTRIRAIRGGQSGYVTDEAAARMQQAGVRVDTIPGAGHFIHIDAPGPLLDLLTS
ncbi:MAG: alpha/beta hydrolase [Myxococcota bacterium]